MKIPLKKAQLGHRNVSISDGRHVGVVVQVVHVGPQPAFNKDDPPVPSIAVAVEFAEGVLARAITISQHPSSLFFGLQLACGMGDVEELELVDFLGKTVACEIENQGAWPKLRSFGPVESVDEVPTSKAQHIAFDVELLDRGEGREEFLQLHPDIRRAVSQRVRSRS